MRNIYLQCQKSPARIRIAFLICMTNCSKQCADYREILKELREKHVQYSSSGVDDTEAANCEGDNISAKA